MIYKVLVSNSHGDRVGQYNLKAVLTDVEVELVRQLHEDGMPYSKIAEKFGVSKSCVQHICTFRRRNTYATGEKVVNE